MHNFRSRAFLDRLPPRTAKSLAVRIIIINILLLTNNVEKDKSNMSCQGTVPVWGGSLCDNEDTALRLWFWNNQYYQSYLLEHWDQVVAK